MTDTNVNPSSVFGWFGFAVGAAALVLTLVIFWAGPFAPQQSAGVSVGELAAEIAKSAARSVAGQPQPEPAVSPRDIDDYLKIAVGILAGIAIVLGVAALVRHEPKRAAMSGIALGGLAVTVQLFAQMVLMIVGVLLIMAVIYALRDVFGGIFAD